MVISDYIKDDVAENLFEAYRFAAVRGAPLNQYLTIHWGLIPGAAEHEQRRLARLLERASKWLNRRGATLAYVWTMERGTAFSAHSHVLLHVRPDLVVGFSRMLGRWVDGAPQAQAIMLKPVKTAGVVRYLLKGMDPAAAPALGIRSRPQGVLTGKRAGTSENLGRLARARWVRRSIRPGRAGRQLPGTIASVSASLRPQGGTDAHLGA